MGICNAVLGTREARGAHTSGKGCELLAPSAFPNTPRPILFKRLLCRLEKLSVYLQSAELALNLLKNVWPRLGQRFGALG